MAEETGPSLGSDVTLFFTGGTLLVSGVGESVEALPPLAGFAVAVAAPPFQMSTPEVYRRWDELEGPSGEEMIARLQESSRLRLREGERCDFVLTAEGRDLILAGAILSILINPFLFAMVDRIFVKRERAVADASAKAEHEADLAREPIHPTGLSDHVVLVGYGRVGSCIGDLLRQEQVPILIIDDNEDAAPAQAASGFPLALPRRANRTPLDRRVDPEIDRHRAGDGVDLVDEDLSILGEEVDACDAPKPGDVGDASGQIGDLFRRGVVEARRQLPAPAVIITPCVVLLVVAVYTVSGSSRSLDGRHLPGRIGPHCDLEVATPGQERLDDGALVEEA